MYCTQCGTELNDQHFYCFKCGAATGRGPIPVPPEPLMRSAVDRKIAGVCAGMAKWARMDVTVMRLLWILLAFGLPPAGLLGYVAAWIIMPMEPYVAPRPAPAQV